jgi:hypothetical protein
MTTGPRTESDIAKNEHDYTLDAKKVAIVGDITNAPDSADDGILTLTGGATWDEVGSNAGSRTVGVQIISRSSSPVYISLGSEGGATTPYIEDNEGLFLPTNLSIYVKGTGSDTVMYWEL